MLKDHLDVAPMGLVVDVEQVAKNGDTSDGCVDRQVSYHLPELMRGHAKLSRFVDDTESDNGASSVTQHRNQSHQRVGT